MTGAIISPRGQSAPADVAARLAGQARAQDLTALWIVAAIVAGWLLRSQMLHAFPLREDEAIYSVWARSVWADPRFLSTWPDKPPLFLWLQALALALLGPSPAAARFVSLAASVATIAVVAFVARQIGGGKAAILAAWLIALSPFAISFAATAYIDSVLVFLGMVSMALLLHGRPLAAGLALGAAIMTKQQGLLYLPLLFAVAWAEARAGGRRGIWLRLLAGVSFIVAPILLWDASRWQRAPSPWDLGVRNYGALALAPPGTWLARLGAWSSLAWQFGASLWAWLLLAAALVAGLATERRKPSSRRSRWLWWLILIWSLGFLLLHLFSTVPAWDRYLLPMAPMLAILVAAPASALLTSSASMLAAVLMAAVILVAPAWTAARGGLPIGADHGAYAGLDEAMAWVRERAKPNEVVYHRVLGWQAQYYLFDALHDGNVDLRWFPSAVYLADNAAKTPQRARYVVEPAWAETRGLLPALLSRGLRLERRLDVEQMTVWEITTPPQPACTWCLCRLPAWSTLKIEGPPAMSLRP